MYFFLFGDLQCIFILFGDLQCLFVFSFFLSFFFLMHHMKRLHIVVLHTLAVVILRMASRGLYCKTIILLAVASTEVQIQE